MGHVNRALGQAGAPIVLRIGERDLKLSPLTKRRQAEVEEWLESRALAIAERSRANLSSDDYVKLLALTNERIDSGDYDFGGECYQRAMKTWEGQAQILLVLLRPHQPKVTLEDVEDILEECFPEVRTALDRVVGGFKAKLGVDDEGNPLPAKEATTPASTGPGDQASPSVSS